jgi:signal transduction histidine kinase
MSKQEPYSDGELFDKQKEKRNKIITALALISATVISLVFLVFALTQKNQVDELRLQLVEMKIIAEQNAQEANKQRVLAEQERGEADQQRALAVAALEECKKSK